MKSRPFGFTKHHAATGFIPIIILLITPIVVIILILTYVRSRGIPDVRDFSEIPGLKNQTENENWETYTNELLGFSFQHPVEAEIKEETNSNSFWITISDPSDIDSEKTKRCESCYQIVVRTIDFSGKTYEEFKMFMDKELRIDGGYVNLAGGGKLVIQSYEATDINGHPALRVIAKPEKAEGNQEDDIYIDIAYVFIAPNEILVFLNGKPQEVYGQVDDVFSNVLNSLKVFDSPVKNSAQARARDAARKAGLASIYRGILIYQVENSDIQGITTIPTCIGTQSPCFDLSALLVPEYFSSLPKDPLNGTHENTEYKIYKDSNGKLILEANGESEGKILYDY